MTQPARAVPVVRTSTATRSIIEIISDHPAGCEQCRLRHRYVAELRTAVEGFIAHEGAARWPVPLAPHDLDRRPTC